MPRARAGGLQRKPAVSANQTCAFIEPSNPSTKKLQQKYLHPSQSKAQGTSAERFGLRQKHVLIKKTARLNTPPRPLHLPLPFTFSLPERIVVTNIPRERSQPMNPDFHRNELVPGRRSGNCIDQTQKPKSRAHWNERLVIGHRPRFQQTMGL